MVLSEEFSSLWSDVTPKLIELVTECASLKSSVELIAETDDIVDLREKLVATRQAQDRIEYIVAELGRLRARARVMVAETRDLYDNAVIEAMQKSRIGEYSSAEERRMTYKAASFDEFRKMRKAEKQEAEVSEAYEYCNLKYRGLDSMRRDIDVMIRSINVQTSLES